MIASLGKSIVILGMGSLLITQPFSSAGEIKSSDFSIGMGAAPINNSEGNGLLWTTRETEETNSQPGENFFLDVHLTGNQMSATGPSFKDRVLGSVSSEEASGVADGFFAIVTGQYTGPAPKDAANPPNYRIQVNITAISVYAVAVTDEMSANFSLNFNEKTSNHEQSQDAVEIGAGPQHLNELSNYIQVSWSPKNFPSESGNLTQEYSRVFNLTESQRGLFAIDGFEISGNIVLLYDSLPQSRHRELVRGDQGKLQLQTTNSARLEQRVPGGSQSDHQKKFDRPAIPLRSFQEPQH